jgi:plastocyanin
MTRRLVLSLLVMAAAACGGGGGGGGSSTSSSAAPAAQTVTFHESEFKITPATQTLKAGTYTFEVINDGSFPHDLWIAPQGSNDALAHSTQLSSQGQKTTFQVDLKAGTYTIWCAVDGHRARGMEGTITVS